MQPQLELIQQQLEVRQHNDIRNYYQFQSKIYDITRWAFLFGRTEILAQIPFEENDSFRIAEIGCGTGYNLENIARRFPNAELIGVDVSEDMLQIAKEKLILLEHNTTFHHLPYHSNSTFLNPAPNIILFSYALSMINPNWKELIQKAYDDLPKGGKIMVTDFYDSDLKVLKDHMVNHHVRMDGHLLPELWNLFRTKHQSTKYAYGGLWQYFMYVGEKA